MAATFLDWSGACGAPGEVGGTGGLVVETENVLPQLPVFPEIDDNGGVGGPGGPVAETKNVVPWLLVFPEIDCDGPSQCSS